MTGGVHNEISGGSFSFVVQGGTVTLQLPPNPSMTAALTGIPAPTPTFTGRDDILAALTEALAPRHAPTDRIHAIAGLAGVGKTELALQIAQRALRRDGWFPGGVLFIDLFGYDEERRLSPEHSLGSLLHALAVPEEHIPAGVQDRQRLYGSLLTAYADQGKRLLVILDNASSPAQAAPLCPADPRIPVLVTSRHTLSGLSGARLHDLSVLEPACSVDLIAETLQAARAAEDTRVRDDPAAAAEIAGLCGHLPLALRIVTALLADLPARPLASLAGSLADARRRLHRLSHGEVAVRAAFDLSYQHLPPDQARLFRLLPLNPGPDLSTESAARLTDDDPSETEDLLAALTRAHLVESGPLYGRWRMHDLIRLYADETGQSHAGTDDRPSAVARLLEHYRDATWDACTHLKPELLDAPRFADRAAALAWLESESSSLVTAVPFASAHGHGELAVRLFIGLAEFLSLRRRFTELLDLCDLSLDIVAESYRPLVRVSLLSRKAEALRELRRFPEALEVQEQALRISEEAGSLMGRAGSLSNLGLTLCEMHRTAEAVPLLRKAIELHRLTGNRYDEGKALTNLGQALEELRRFDEAEDAYRQDIGICREIGDRHGEAITLNNLGIMLREAGRNAEAVRAHEQASEAFLEASDPHGHAENLCNLGTALRQGRFDTGIDGHTEAAAAFRALGDPHGEGLALLNLGVDHFDVGMLEAALGFMEEAGRLLLEAGDPHAHAGALLNAGIVLSAAGRPGEAIEKYRLAVSRFRELHTPHEEAKTLYMLGQVLWRTGHPDAADTLDRAAAAFRLAGDPDRAAKAETLLETLRKAATRK